MKNNHKSSESIDMPEIRLDLHGNSPKWKYTNHYGNSRGSRGFETGTEANEDMLNFIDMRVNTLSKQMFELLRMKRRLLKQRPVALEPRAPIRMTDTQLLHKRLEELEFENQSTGGGCTAHIREWDHRYYVMITDGDMGGDCEVAANPDYLLVGLYDRQDDSGQCIYISTMTIDGLETWLADEIEDVIYDNDRGVIDKR